MDAEILDRRLVYDGWYKLWRLTVRMPDGSDVERHLEDHGSAVAVLPYDPVRRVALLVSMPRAPVLDAGVPPLLEVIAGNCDGDAEAVVRREAHEEGGLHLRDMRLVAESWSMPSLSTERIALYLAPYGAGDRIAPGGGCDGEHECIAVHELPLRALRAERLAGRLTDAKTLLLVQALELAAPHLFDRHGQDGSASSVIS